MCATILLDLCSFSSSQVNKPPKFTSTVFNATVSEGAAAGAVVTTVTATTLNTVDSLTYSILGANPPGALSWWSIDPVLGNILVSPSIAGGFLTVDTGLQYPSPWAVNISLRVTNAGGLIANSSVLISIINIAPRVTAVVNATVRNNATAWTPVVAGLGAAVWTPYSPSTLRYTLTSAVTAGFGLAAFNISNALTGAVAVSNVSYVDPRSYALVLGPDFNMNAQPTLTSSWIVTDTATGRSSSPGSLVVTVLHSNRAPYFNLPPDSVIIPAPQTTVGTFGQAISVVTTDLDLALNLGELGLRKVTRPRGTHPPSHRCSRSCRREAHVLDRLQRSPTQRAHDRLQHRAAQHYFGQCAGGEEVCRSLVSIRAPSLMPPQVLNSNYTVTIGVRDAGIDGPALTVLRNFTLNVFQTHAAPTVPSYVLSIPELSPAGTFVANVTGYSPNFQSKLSYTLVPTTYVANFPFAISATGGTGTITVGSGAQLLFGPGPRQYVCTLTVSDNADAGALYASSVVTINVTYVQRPPYFNQATQAPNSAWFQLEVRLREAGCPARSPPRPHPSPPPAPVHAGE